MPLGMEVGLGPGHIVANETELPKKGHSLPNFRPMSAVAKRLLLMDGKQTPGWIKMPFGTKVDLGPGHIVLHGEPALPKRATAPQFSVHVYCGHAITHLSYC